MTASEIDFDTLCVKAYPPEQSENPNTAAMNELWKNLFEIKQWHFLISPSSLEEGNPYPFIAQIGEEAWTFAFTDSKKLHDFALLHGFIQDTDEDIQFISMETDAARGWLTDMSSKGLHGIRFNDGEFGWTSPADNLNNIYNFVFAEK